MAYHQAEWPRNLRDRRRPRAGRLAEIENFVGDFKATGHSKADMADGGKAARCGEPTGGGTACAGILDVEVPDMDGDARDERETPSSGLSDAWDA